MWFTYIIQTKNGNYYTGITTDVERRFEEHKNSPKGAKYTRANPPKKIVYIKECENRSEASKEEARIKKLTRPQKEKLVKEYKTKP